LTPPPDPLRFVDRRDELQRLRDHWVRGDNRLVIVVGHAGVGKSALLLTFARLVEDSGGYVAFASHDASLPSAADVIEAVAPHGSNGVLFWDKPPEEEAAGRVLMAVRSRAPDVMVVATSRDREEAERLARLERPGAPPPLVLALEGLPNEALEVLLGALLPACSTDDICRLADASEGSPLVAHVLASLATRESVDTVLQRLAEQSFETVGRYDGRFTPEFSRLAADVPLSSLPYGRDVEVRVKAVGDDLIRRCAQRPELMQELGPRKFEELMAELYARQGFEVELTPQTRDGGVDLYVVRYEPFGRMVTLVDAKRMRLDRKVGVGVVRQLFGVVEAQRASAGVIATTSFFTRDAQRYSEQLGFRMFLQGYLDLQKMLRDTAGPT
jgi:restriction system protein